MVFEKAPFRRSKRSPSTPMKNKAHYVVPLKRVTIRMQSDTNMRLDEKTEFNPLFVPLLEWIKAREKKDMTLSSHSESKLWSRHSHPHFLPTFIWIMISKRVVRHFGSWAWAVANAWTSLTGCALQMLWSMGRVKLEGKGLLVRLAARVAGLMSIASLMLSSVRSISPER